jgi:LuxR family maltose regulon positive regulatory protein
MKTVHAKLQVPQVAGKLLRRPRLLQLLGRRVRETDIALLQAPAGSGKTVLAADWVATALAPGRHGWLNLDKLDNDPQRFLHYLNLALGGGG